MKIHDSQVFSTFCGWLSTFYFWNVSAKERTDENQPNSAQDSTADARRVTWSARVHRSAVIIHFCQWAAQLQLLRAVSISISWSPSIVSFRQRSTGLTSWNSISGAITWQKTGGSARTMARRWNQRKQTWRH